MQDKRRGFRPRETVFVSERSIPGGREFRFERPEDADSDGRPMRAVRTARSFSWVPEAANDEAIAGGPGNDSPARRPAPGKDLFPSGPTTERHLRLFLAAMRYSYRTYRR